MGNYEYNSSNPKKEELFIEKNAQLGQEEDDFEIVFNQVFKKDENQELEKDYSIDYINNFIQDERIYSNEENFIEKEEGQTIKVIRQKYKDNKIFEKNRELESDINENNNLINIEINTNNISIDPEKKNKFRVYSSNDFNLFHPWANQEYLSQIQEEIKNEITKVKKEENKKFKISNTKTKRPKKKIKEKKKRKEKPDDVRKKIKARFLKSTKNRINQMLKSANSKLYFDFLPQCFVCNISKVKNKPIINMKFKELLSQRFFEEEEKNDKESKKKIKRDKKKYDTNIKVLRYLEKNDNICKKSNFNIIGNMTFKDIFNEYLKSEEFEKEIEKLKIENNNNEIYVKNYIINAFNFINYFSKKN